MRIAICEDNLYFLNYASKVINKVFALYSKNCKIDIFSDSRVFLDKLNNHSIPPYHIIFLDIDMPQIDGISIGSFLRKTNVDSFIIYLSNMEELVFDTFKTRPFSFIPKSQFKNRIHATIEAVYTAYKEKNSFVTLTINNTNYHWNIHKLIYIECSNKILHLHFTHTNLDVMYQIGLLENALTEYGFIRSHKGFLVNYRFIFCIEKDFILLDDQTKIPLSKHRAVNVKNMFIQLTV